MLFTNHLSAGEGSQQNKEFYIWCAILGKMVTLFPEEEQED